MRIWHEKLIPKLCRQHLLAVWREGLGCYSIIVEGKKGYRNHPAVKEFEHAPQHLWDRLLAIRLEMKKRGYKPKDMPKMPYPVMSGMERRNKETIREWQSLEEQIRVLRSKGCLCQINN